MPFLNKQKLRREFTPADLFRKYTDGFWLDAARGTCTDAARTTPTGVDAATILGWTDQSGKGRHFSHASIGATLKTGIINGRWPVLRGPGGASGARLDGASINAWTEGEIFVVLKADADPVADIANSALWDMGTDTTTGHYPYTDGTVYSEFGTSTRPSYGNPTTSLASFHILNQWSKTSDFGLRINRGSHVSETAGLAVGFAAAPLLFINSYAGHIYSFKGDIAEIICTNAKLTAREKSSVENYLSKKYGIALT